MGYWRKNWAAPKAWAGCLPYLMLAEKPKTLDEIAAGLKFSKATASLTVRQGVQSGGIRKVSRPGDRRDYYRLDLENALHNKFKSLFLLKDAEKLMDYALLSCGPEDPKDRGTCRKSAITIQIS
jgi:DNA-binding transcriptional regulator GbsR (MarR family)